MDCTKIQFTPQTKFFETTEDWSVALQDIYAGQDAKSRLDALAAASPRRSTPERARSGTASEKVGP